MSPPHLLKRQLSLKNMIHQRSDTINLDFGPELSCVSLRSHMSMSDPIMFQKAPCCPENKVKQKLEPTKHGFGPGSEIDCECLKDDHSMSAPIAFKDQVSSLEDVDLDSLEVPLDDSVQNDQTHLASVFKVLEETMVTFVRKELKKFQRVLTPDCTESLGSGLDDEEVMPCEDKEQKQKVGEMFLKLTVDVLRLMKEKELADCLQSRSPAMCQLNLKASLKDKFQFVFEGIAKAGNPTLLNQIYTELYITEGGTGEVNNEHEVRQIETTSKKEVKLETKIRCEDIFIPTAERNKSIRTMMTKGVAGIGKTILTQKFTLDWAENKANQDVQFMFPFTFRELNLLKEKKLSLVDLVHHVFTETKKAGISRFEEFQVVFIFDGLDECRLPLDFHKNEILTDVSEPASVDVLLTNLIKGNLLPSAHLWITTRPAAANQIPPDCVDMVTEVRGFNDPQKEEYFQRRFRDEKVANRIVSHIRTSRSLHIMCHIPVFCWITATVLEDVLKAKEGKELPKTLTEMYIYFLVVQTKRKNIKYNGGDGTDQHWNPESREMILSLGKLAFQQLQKGNITFYESDLLDCGLNIKEASVYSGVFTQIFKEERGLYQEKMFCFIHLSIQEFLAALHVHLTFTSSGVNLMSDDPSKHHGSTVQQFYKSAVDQAFKSPNGHLDLFLRFLLGLSIQPNQVLLQGLLPQAESCLQTDQDKVQYIKGKIEENPGPEKSINLFHCLNELKDHSLVEEIQQYLKMGSLATDQLSSAQWSALVFILLSSEKDLNVFDLKKYCASEEALLKLLPVVRASKKVLLSGCNLSGRSCEALSSVLSSQSTSLKELDLSNNDLQDSGVELLVTGLESPHCTLETLRLSGCLITDNGCSSLASALNSNPSHLRELDLSYNHPGESAVKLLSSKQEDPQWSLDTFISDPVGAEWLRPGLRKYFRQLTLDPNTAHKFLRLSEDNKRVTDMRKENPYPAHPERFDYWPQVLSKNGMTDRYYWEVEWEGKVYIAVSYKGIGRNGDRDASKFGGNDQSWSLTCTDGGYNAWHDNKGTLIPLPACAVSHRVGVYLDYPSGSLSFYKVSSDYLTHLHTFNTTFTGPLYAGFGYGLMVNAFAYLCPI